MTCIVVLKTGTQIVLAGDRLQTRGNSKQLCETKLYTVGDFTFGFCGNLRLSQAVQHGWSQPSKLESVTDNQYIFNDFIPSLKSFLIECDFGDRKPLHDICELGIIIYKSTVYRLSWDFSLQEVSEFEAVGCGDNFAKGFFKGCGEVYDTEEFLTKLFKTCSEEDPFVSEEYTTIKFDLEGNLI